ncbi:hypothetical protein [Geothrix sp. 21YS21S-2]|uniref:hypothetical protein n=1 Tax=Geothrix sp. 21YS21S-2 TaxID=3068893 RepID=UPI0027BA2EA8|nr:hypothetical protein [Geothrix sp. 21YS21S-2]
MPFHCPKALVAPALAILASPLFAGTVEILNPTAGTYTVQRNASLLPDSPAAFRTAWDNLQLPTHAKGQAASLEVTTPGILKFVLKDGRGDFCLIKVRTKLASGTLVSTLETLDHRAATDGALRLEQGNRIVITKAFFEEKGETKDAPVDGTERGLGDCKVSDPEPKEAPGTSSTPDAQAATGRFQRGLQEALTRCRTVLGQISRLETSVEKRLALKGAPSNRDERAVARETRVDLANALRDLDTAGAQCQFALELAAGIPGDRTPEVAAQCVTLEQLELMLHAQETSLLTLAGALEVASR